MCRKTTCKKCGQPDWAGCGAHVEQVLGDVPRADRCQCRTGGAPARPTFKTTPKQAGPQVPVAPVGGRSFLDRFRKK